MAGAQHTTRRALLGGAGAWLPGLTPNASAAPDPEEITRLAVRLAELVNRYQRAEKEADRIFRRIYPRGRDAIFADVPEFDAEAYEHRTGYDAACDVMDVIFDRISDLSRRIIAMPSLSPGALSLKAKACFWEATPESLEREGFQHVVAFLTQLAHMDRLSL